jgi:hypothetical protein
MFTDSEAKVSQPDTWIVSGCGPRVPHGRHLQIQRRVVLAQLGKFDTAGLADRVEAEAGVGLVEFIDPGQALSRAREIINRVPDVRPVVGPVPCRCVNAYLGRFVELIEADLQAAGFVRRGPVFRYFDSEGNGIALDIQRTTALRGRVEFFVNVGVLLAAHLR